MTLQDPILGCLVFRGTANSGVIGSPLPAMSPTSTTASPSFVVMFAALNVTVTDSGRLVHDGVDGDAEAEALLADANDEVTDAEVALVTPEEPETCEAGDALDSALSDAEAV